jgi:enamine deaminase RidA (YjgF/YER057c/UK114 family)
MNDTAHTTPVTLNPTGLATPGGHYSHVAIGNGMVFISGQLPIDASGHKLTEASFEMQALQVLANVEAALAGAGSDIGKLLQVRIYLTDVAHWPAFNDIYARWAGSAARRAPWCRSRRCTSACRSKWRPRHCCDTAPHAQPTRNKDNPT